ncbi:glycosyltransferase [Prochlorococcus sp. MIT 1318]|uniref:glycosyltransferase n=1 Tax=Prochlorococcus sp. MIT 1318 TaxID=3082531 RepID=UPI0039B5DA27
MPEEVRGIVADWNCGPLQAHDLDGDYPSGYLVSILVPCFNPNPDQFEQLLLSLQQQSDQRFNVLLVNDGSTQASRKYLEQLADDYSWLRIIHQPTNQGISAALNLAVKELQTPYVAIVDQDDLLHPAALAFVNRHLSEHEECGFLYSDHIAFADDGSRSQYIAKFPWNPDVLLEFNYLIHLTVIRIDLYQACGGMNSKYDGIQDWEFYIRLTKLLTPQQVGYLPLPLYAWRLSDHSVASSATPKQQLLEKAIEFLDDAYQHRGETTRVALDQQSASHYKFGIDRSEDGSGASIRRCNILLLGDLRMDSYLQSTLQSIQSSGILFDQIYLVQPPNIFSPVSPVEAADGLQVSLVSCLELNSTVPDDKPLLVLQIGSKLLDKFDSSLIPWLESSSRWQVITFPCLSIQEPEICISAGYANLPLSNDTYIPLAQGLAKSDYINNFASYSHTRSVDLPSPAVQLLCSDVVSQALIGFESIVQQVNARSDSWFSCLIEKSFRCCCISSTWVGLAYGLSAQEYEKLFQKRGHSLVAMSSDQWMSEIPDFRFDFEYWLGCSLREFGNTAHPLFVHHFLSSPLHPSKRLYESKSARQLSLMPKPVHRPLVMLIPTEINARSNGHACMLTLALELQSAGCQIHLLPFKPLTFFRKYYQNLPIRYKSLSFIADPSEVPASILMVPESAPKFLVKSLRPYFQKIIWWLLAPSGVLTDFCPDIRIGDYLLSFSEFALPGQIKHLFLQPELDVFFAHQLIKHRHQNSLNKQVLFYSGKGRLKSLPRSLHRHLLDYKITIITRSFPSEKSELIQLLVNSRGLISCDPMTNLNLEAALLGLPVYLTSNPFPDSCFRDFPVDLSSLITASPGYFIQRLLDSSPLPRLRFEDLIAKNKSSVDFCKYFLADPEPLEAMAYRVNQKSLDTIDRYRRTILRSRSIQALKDGQSLSSSFLDVYAYSFKSPYWLHRYFGKALQMLDDTANCLASIHLLTPAWQLWHKLGCARLYLIIRSLTLSLLKILNSSK